MVSEGARSGVSHFFLNLLRIGAGLLIMQHGAQKLLGRALRGSAVLGPDEGAALFTQLWVAGMLEFWGGLLIVVGLLTRPVAALLALEMLVAYVQAHIPRGD